MSQRIVNADLNRFFLSYTLAKESRFKDPEAFQEECIQLLLQNKCFEIKGYTPSCILFTVRKDKDYDFWHKLIYRTFRNDIRFVFGEIAKRSQPHGELEIGRFKSLRYEDRLFSANFDKILLRIELELNKRPVK
jgi:hypothetical protein